MKFEITDENGQEAGIITTTDLKCAERIAKTLFGDKATVKEVPPETKSTKAKKP